MTYRTLWRIDGRADAGAVDHERLAAGLRLHVLHSPLTTITMQIDMQQRAYLVLAGCAGCLRGQCSIGCPAALFRRLFQACASDARLIAVPPPQGLASRSYTRGGFAWPELRAQPIDSALLQRWKEARMIIQWRRYGAQIGASVLLLTGADGPDPSGTLRDHHWHGLTLPIRMVTRWQQTATPPGLPFGAPWQLPPFLLLPTSSVPAPSSAAPVQAEPATSTNDSQHAASSRKA